VVEIGRSTYRTLARLYPDSDEVFEVEWYEARPDAPLLGTPSALNSLIWARDHDEYLQTAVGEIPLAPFVKVPYQQKILATGDHVCGTAEDFAGQGVYDDTSPDVTYRSDGLPTCCGAAVEGMGGLGLSGTAAVSPDDGTEGGLEIGGSAGDLVTYVDPTAGGLEIGGSAGDLVTYVDPTAGGLEIGGSAGDVLAYTDPAQGGLALGGAEPDEPVYADPTQGGVELGGAAGDLVVYTDPTQGGLEIGGAAGDVVVYTDPTQGGIEIGGQAGESLVYVDATQGGLALGGEAGDVGIGSISTENATGGPESLTAAIVLIGGAGIILSQTGPDITIAVQAVGPTPGPPTGLGAVTGNTQVTVSWTAPSGSPPASSYIVYYGTSSSFGSAAEFAAGITGTSEVVTSLVNNTLYYFWVASVYNGSSALAGPVTCTPSADALYDTFAGTSGTNLTSHAPNVGGPWYVQSGETSMQLGSGGLNTASETGPNVAPIGSPDQTCTIEYYYPSALLVTGGTASAIVRASSSLSVSGYFGRVAVATGGACTLEILQYPGGTVVASESITALVGGTLYTIVTSANSSNQIKVVLGSNSVTYTDTTLTGNTYAGIYGSGQTGSYVSQITVTSP